MPKNMPKNENETEYYNLILEKIESSYLSGNFDISILNSGKNEILDRKNENNIYHIYESRK